MSMNRRDFLRHGLLFVPAATILPQVFVRSLAASPGGAARNVLLVELFGGNDGFNMMVPFGVDGGSYYSEFRPTVGVPEPSVLKVAGSQVGFHPALAGLKAHFDAGRLAVIQGVSYPQPDFSHEVSQRIWHTGVTTGLSAEGWLARYLNLFPAPSFPCAAEILSGLSGLVGGVEGFVPSMTSLSHFSFPIDWWHPQDGSNRRAAYDGMAQANAVEAGALGAMAGTQLGVLDLIDTVATIPEVSYTGSYPEHWFSNSLKLVLRMLNADLGMRVYHLGLGGFDTHDAQNDNDYHTNLLSTLSEGLAALHTDLVALGLDQDTIVVVFSEFGRTVYENGSGGTDHGSVNPVLVLGTGVNGGFTTPHPSLDPGNLTPWHEPPMVADFRDVFGTLLLRWYGESPATVGQVFPGHATTDLGFLP